MEVSPGTPEGRSRGRATHASDGGRREPRISRRKALKVGPGGKCVRGGSMNGSRAKGEEVERGGGNRKKEKKLQKGGKDVGDREKGFD